MLSRRLAFASLLVLGAACGSKGLRSVGKPDSGSDGPSQARDTINARLDEDACSDLGRDQNPDRRAQGPETDADAAIDAAIDTWPDTRLPVERDALDTRLPDVTILDGGSDRFVLGPNAADAPDALPDRPVLGDAFLGDAFLGDAGLAADSPSTLELVAGVLGGLGTADGIGLAARFFMPSGIVYDGQDRLFVADEGNHVVRQVVVSTGAVSTLAGVAQRFGFADGVGEGARFQSPTGITSDGQGSLFVIDSGNHVVRKIVVATGAVSTVPELVEQGGVRTIVGNLQFSSPSVLVHDRQGALYIAEVGVIRKLVLDTGVLTVVAGSGMSGDRDGVGSAAELSHPGGLALDGAGHLVVADTQNASIRKIDLATRQVTTIDRTTFTWPQMLASDGQGALYVVDAVDSTLRRLVLATGEVTLVAGTAGKAGPDDGTGASARLSGPSRIVLDGVGNAFIADKMNHVVRKVVLGTGVVTTLAGRVGEWGNQDGIGTQALFYRVGGLASDGAGNLFVADPDNQSIRKVVLDTGAVSTVVGSPDRPGAMLGPLPASLGYPTAVAFVRPGHLFIADSGESVILRARF